MKKNLKARAHEKRKQAKALKDRRKKAQKAKAQNQRPAGPPQAEFPEVERTFWMLHGCNFLASDYTEGTWTPLFPEIYEGAEPTEETIASRLKKVAAPDELSPSERAVLGYALQPRQNHYAFKLNAERLVQATKGENHKVVACQPHQPVVWKMFHEEVIVKAVQRAGAG